MAVEILERELCGEAEAARLLRMHQHTLHYWLEGRTYRGRSYAPVLRPEPKGVKVLTWAEFVEASLLRTYRKHHQVPMQQLRQFIERLRQEFGVPYPLADRRPFVTGKKLVVKAQEQTGLADDYWLVVESVDRQLMLTPSGAEFLDRVVFESDTARAWRPMNEAASPVLLDPLVRGGRPNVSGISTEVIWEHVESGEDPADVAETFGLKASEVRWALAYENSSHAA